MIAYSAAHVTGVGVEGICLAAAISMDMPGTLTIRAATTADATRLAAFARKTFSDAFAAQNTPQDMALYLGAAMSDARVAAELADTARLTLLAELDNALVAYAQLAHSEVPVYVPDAEAIELVRFYIDRPWHGRGLAERLMQRVERAAAARARTIWLGVWEKNARAIAFYRKCGFTDVGSHPFLLGRDLQIDRIMARSLG